MAIDLKIDNVDGFARACTLSTTHGDILTPVFMPVGTLGTVKSLTNTMLQDIGTQIILGNTYHLMLRPNIDVIKSFNGLHSFMNWSKPILTDSGGFQVMSLSGLRKINENGVTFQSHVDGTRHLLTPESSIELQHSFNSTITMVFDECISYPASYKNALLAMERSTRWASRSKDAYVNRDGYGIFGIVQGGSYDDLRQKSIHELINIGFDGYAIGGLAVGEGQVVMFNVLDKLMQYMPTKNPRYLMGVGKPSDILGAVLRGVDMFDCVLPTRNARNGLAYTRNGEIKVRRSIYSKINRPLDSKCLCYTCQNHSIGYLSHLCRTGEILACTLMTIHNLKFYHDMMSTLRSMIISNNIHKLDRYDHLDFSWVE